MERKTNPLMVGGLVAVAALLLSPLGSKNASTGRSTQTSRAVGGLSGSSSEQNESEALSRNDRGPWYALCQEFLTSPPEAASDEQVEEVERTVKDNTGEHKYSVKKRTVANLSKCVPDGFSNFRFLIATVADPIASHLDIEFDRSVESLQRAGSLLGYNFERYWLPWRKDQDTATENSSPATTRSEERWRQDQPGLLIFRQATSDERLLIFLVGETPTAGLNRIAFANALKYIDQLSPPTITPQILVAGPIFSGTLPGLGESIVQYRASHLPAKPIFNVANYGARSDDLRKAFRKQLDRDHFPGTTFSSLDLSTNQAQMELVNYFCGMNYDVDEIAILAEDASAYGTAVLAVRDNPKSGIAGANSVSNSESSVSPKAQNSGCASESDHQSPLGLHFPRDLSAIRNATEAEMTQPEAQQIGGIALPSTGVALTLRQEETNEHDAPPDFAQTQSSARLDRELLAIVKRLRAGRIQALIVTATNPLDRVFLLEYLHVNVPDIRLATVGADDFMLARPKFIDLSGTLAVTSLPLLSENVITVRENQAEGKVREQKQYIDFPSNAAEGIFLATAILLGPGRPLPNEDVDTDQCADISIVGKTGFRVAVKNDEVVRRYPCFSQQDTRSAMQYPSTVPLWTITIGQPGRNGSTNSGSSNVRRPIPFIWAMALIILLVGSTSHLVLACSSNNWLKLGALPVVPRFVLCSSGMRKSQAFFLLAATVQVALLEFIAVTTTWALGLQMLRAVLFYQKLLVAAHVLLLAGAWLLCGWLIFYLLAEREQDTDPTSENQGKSRLGLRLGALISFVYLVSTAVFWWVLLGHGHATMNMLVARRTIYLLEGLTPVVPVFFVLLAYYLWALNNLRRLSLVVQRVSLHIPNDSAPAEELGRMVQELQCSIASNVEISFSALGFVAATILACCLLKLTSALRGFETGFQLWLLSWGFVLLLVILIAAFHRSWSVWIRMRKVLHFLDATSLGRAFSHLPKELSSMRIWSVGGTRFSVLVQVRTAELLEKMDLKYPIAQVHAVGVGADDAVNAAGATVTNQRTSLRGTTFSVLREVRSALETTGVVTHSLARQLSTVMNRRMPQTGFLFDPGADVPPDLAPGERNLLELYVAYRFVAFFRYVMLQIRNMLAFVIYGYACLLVGMTAYPFQGRQSLGTLMSLVFVLLLGGVAAMMVQMYRDPILKRLEEPSSGLSGTFEIVVKLAGVAGVPILAVLASQFPSLAEVISNWIQPLVEGSH